MLLGQEPDPSLLVRVGNLEWVYASPCGGDPTASCGATLLHHGFGFATTEQWNASFTSLAALDTAFTVDGEARCAASYSSVDYDECQVWDMRYGYVWGAPFGNGFGDYSAELFLVRAVDASQVPEPASLGLAWPALPPAAASANKRRATQDRQGAAAPCAAAAGRCREKACTAHDGSRITSNQRQCLPILPSDVAQLLYP